MLNRLCPYLLRWSTNHRFFSLHHLTPLQPLLLSTLLMTPLGGTGFMHPLEMRTIRLLPLDTFWMKIGQKLSLSTPTALGHDLESMKSVILNERLTKDVLAMNYGHLFVSSVPTSCTLRHDSMVFVWHLCDWCGSRISFQNLFSTIVFCSMPCTKNWSWIFWRNVPMGPNNRINGFHTCSKWAIALHGMYESFLSNLNCILISTQFVTQ